MTIIPHKTTNRNALVSVTTFTGKEWCKSQWFAQRGLERGISETGFSYFGARYYDSDLSGLFMSVDPMSDKYPSMSPYSYCAWNPVSLVDPDGKDVYRLDTETGSLVLYERNNNKYDIIEAGTISGIGRAKGFKVSSTKKVSKGILNGEYGHDISQTGFVTYSNKQEEALGKKETILYDENGRIPYGVRLLPESLHLKY